MSAGQLAPSAAAALGGEDAPAVAEGSAVAEESAAAVALASASELCVGAGWGERSDEPSSQADSATNTQR
jgi:hypothetical protein